MTEVDPVIAARSRLGVAVRTGDPSILARARQEMVDAKLARAVMQALSDGASSAERERLGNLLLSGVA